MVKIAHDHLICIREVSLICALRPAIIHDRVEIDGLEQRHQRPGNVPRAKNQRALSQRQRQQHLLFLRRRRFARQQLPIRANQRGQAAV